MRRKCKRKWERVGMDDNGEDDKRKIMIGETGQIR